MGLHRLRYIKTASSSSEEEPVIAPDSEENFEEAVRKTTEQMIGYQFSGEIDQRLWDNVVLPPTVRTAKNPNSRPNVSQN